MPDWGELSTTGAFFLQNLRLRTAWLCLNCGQVITATRAPEHCPVCRHGQDWFIRLELAPFTKAV